MAHNFKRLELCNLVWSQPTRDIARRFEISDVGLAKACCKSRSNNPSQKRLICSTAPD